MTKHTSLVLALFALLALGACGTTGDSPHVSEDPQPGPVEAGPDTTAQEETGQADPPLAWDEVQREPWRVSAGKRALFAVAWRPVGETVPRNEAFEVEARVFRGGELFRPSHFLLRGWMPGHEHGFVADPLVTEMALGTYRVEGVLLHMRGDWQLFFEVQEGKDIDLVEFPVRVK